MAGYLHRQGHIEPRAAPATSGLDLSIPWASASYAECLSVFDPLQDCIAIDHNCSDSPRPVLLFRDAPGLEVVNEASLRFIARSPEPTTVRSSSARNGIRPDDVRNHVVSD